MAHPVNPPHYVPVVELVPAPWTDAAVVDKTRALMLQLGQAPVTLRKEVNGFIINRLQVETKKKDEEEEEEAEKKTTMI